jgi:hypothetical protein
MDIDRIDAALAADEDRPWHQDLDAAAGRFGVSRR